MKKLFSLLCALLFLGSMGLQAAPVSPTQALDIARRVFASQPATKAGAGQVTIIWDGEDVATKAAQPAFYVITRDGGGFVIIAGDDNARPILGISDTNDFQVEGMPGNVRAWMEYMKAYVRSATTRSPEITKQWALLTATKAPIDESLVTNKNTASATGSWNQFDPANGKAPIVTGQTERAVCGCLPLAMAEIMTWFGWPNTAVGTAPAYDSQKYTTAGQPDGTYPIPALDLEDPDNFDISDNDWTALKDLDTYEKFQNCTDPIRTKLAQLVYACGVVLEAYFNDRYHGGTGAESTFIPALFSKHFKYNKGMYRDFPVNHTPREWNAILKAQVLQHPVLYCGLASMGGGDDAGHAYVLDGHALLGDEDVFHFNFGWAGSCNGYYYASYQDMRDVRPYKFDTSLEALLDFVPDKTGKSSYAYKIQYYNSKGMPGMKFDPAFDANDYFNIKVCIANCGSTTYNGKLKAELVDKAGNKKADFQFYLSDGYYDEVQDLPLGIWWTDTYRIRLMGSPTLAFGDRIVLYCTTDEAKTLFAPIPGYQDGTTLDALPIMPAAFIKTESSYARNSYFNFALVNQSYAYAGTVWTITEPDGNVVEKKQSEREFKLTQAGRYRIQADVKPTVDGSLTETLVTYITVH